MVEDPLVDGIGGREPAPTERAIGLTLHRLDRIPGKTRSGGQLSRVKQAHRENYQAGRQRDDADERDA
jgi:hypothetical protein